MAVGPAPSTLAGMAQFFFPQFLAALLLASAPPAVSAGGALSVEVIPKESAPAAAPSSGQAALEGSARPPGPDGAEPPEPAPSADPGLKQTAEQEVLEHQGHVRQLAQQKTSQSIQTIATTTENTKSEVKVLIDQEANRVRTEQAKEIDKLIKKETAEMKANREKIEEESQETLNEVKDTAEIAASESAKKAVENVVDQANRELDFAEKEANAIKEVAVNLTNRAVEAADMSVKAAKNASMTSAMMPQEQSAKAVAFAKKAQNVARALQSQARYVRRIAVLTSATADKTLAMATEAAKAVNVAKSVSDEAVEQVRENAQLLKTITKMNEITKKNAYQANMNALQANYASQRAIKRYHEYQSLAAQQEGASAPAEALDLIAKKRRTLKSTLTPAPAPGNSLAATVLRSRLVMGAEARDGPARA